MFLLCLGCENKSKVDKPDDLISKEEMSNIMYEMFIISSSKGSSVTLLRDNGIQPDEFILDKYGIDSLQFVRSNDYYAHDIEAYNEILTTIKDRVEKEKEELQVLIDQEEVEKENKADSIRDANKGRLIPGTKMATKKTKDSLVD